MYAFKLGNLFVNSFNLISQIKKFGGNISKTAKFVGMERSALHRKLKILVVKDLN